MAIPTPVEPTTRSPRLAVFDGLRGIAIILVVISHGWTLWPTTEIVKNSGVKALFSSGDFAVSVFFVIGAFLATRSLLRDAERPQGLRPGVALSRRWIRLSGQMYALLLVVLLVTALDSTDTYPETATRESAFRAATYTWNWYAANNAFEARPDLGHLWYLSVDMQMFVITLVLVWLLRRHRALLILALGGTLLALMMWRTHIYEYEGPYHALLRTWARGDASMTGALAAATLPYVRGFVERGRYTTYASLATLVALFSLIPLAYYTSPPDGYFHFPGVLLDVALFAVVLGCTVAPLSRIAVVPLGWAPLAFLGRHSLSIYLWHYPIFWFVARHSVDWEWWQRVLLAFSVTAVAAFLSERLVEARVQRWLASPRWHDTDRGLARYVGAQALDAVAEGRARLRRPRHAEAPATSEQSDADSQSEADSQSDADSGAR